MAIPQTTREQFACCSPEELETIKWLVHAAAAQAKIDAANPMVKFMTSSMRIALKDRTTALTQLTEHLFFWM